MFYNIINESTSNEVYPVFVMMSHSGSFVSHVIRAVTGQPYSHASVSFDYTMKNMFSFGSGKISMTNFIIGGFAKENFTDSTLFDPDTTYAIYVTFVAKEERDEMLKELLRLSDENANHELKYNFIGLLYNAANKQHDRGDTYFCSQFTAAILKAGNKGFNRHSSLVRPGDFKELKDFKFVAKGFAADFDAKKIKDKLALLATKTDKTVIYESAIEHKSGFVLLP